MCLGVPGEVTSVDGLRATVDFWGVEKEVRLDTVDAPVEPGDYILNHVGFAIRRIPEDEIAETMELYESFMTGDPSDMLTEDVMDEIEAGGSVPVGAADGLAAGEEPAEEQAADADDAEDLLEELDIDV
jgi:hydrogenase expression/formation protein HypC